MQQYSSEQRVSDNAPGRDAGCQRAVESQSSAEFFAGALLLAQVLNLAQAWLTPLAAWHGMFIFAAGMTLLPVPYVFRLNNTQVLNQLRQENS